MLCLYQWVELLPDLCPQNSTPEPFEINLLLQHRPSQHKESELLLISLPILQIAPPSLHKHPLKFLCSSLLQWPLSLLLEPIEKQGTEPLNHQSLLSLWDQKLVYPASDGLFAPQEAFENLVETDSEQVPLIFELSTGLKHLFIGYDRENNSLEVCKEESLPVGSHCLVDELHCLRVRR